MTDLPGIFILRGKHAGDKPANGRLRAGEIAINEFDKLLFLHDPASSTPIEIDLAGLGGGLADNLASLTIGNTNEGSVKLVKGAAGFAGRIEFYAGSVRTGYIGYYENAVGINTTVPLKYNGSEVVNIAKLNSVLAAFSSSDNQNIAMSDALLFNANNTQLFAHGLPSGGFLRSQILLKCIAPADGFKIGDVFNFTAHTFLNVTDLKNGTVRLNSNFNQSHYIVSPTNTHHNITAHHYRWRAHIILERVE